MCRVVERREYVDSKLNNITKKIFNSENVLICDLNCLVTGEISKKFLYVYDSSNNLIETHHIGGVRDKDIDFKKYDSNNNLIEETNLIDGKISDRYKKYKYDNKNRLIEESYHTGDILRSKETTEYIDNQEIQISDNGKVYIIESNSVGEYYRWLNYDSNGILQYTVEHKFNNAGKKISSIVTKLDKFSGYMNFYTNETWSYDSNGKLTESRSFNSLDKMTYYYSFDSKERKTKMISYYGFGGKIYTWEYFEKEITKDELSKYVSNKIEKNLIMDHTSILLELTLALTNQDKTKIENIIAKYENYNWQNLKGNLLIQAVEIRDISIVKLLLENRIGNINTKNMFGHSPMELAIQYNLIDIVNLFNEYNN